MKNKAPVIMAIAVMLLTSTACQKVTTYKCVCTWSNILGQPKSEESMIEARSKKAAQRECDGAKYGFKKIDIVIPKRNQIGLAYNF